MLSAPIVSYDSASLAASRYGRHVVMTIHAACSRCRLPERGAWLLRLYTAIPLCGIGIELWCHGMYCAAMSKSKAAARLIIKAGGVNTASQAIVAALTPRVEVGCASALNSFRLRPSAYTEPESKHCQSSN